MRLKQIVFSAVLAAVVVYLSIDPTRHTLRYQVTGLNSHVLQPLPATFTDYVTSVTNMEIHARRLAGVDASPIVIAENTPRVLLPNPSTCRKNSDGRYDNGILLIHGFTDSPYSLHVLAEYFQRNCFVVNSILLPGHGTAPGDLLQVHYQDWMAVVDYGVSQLSRQVQHIDLLGYSLGGLLAVQEAIQQPKKISRLILIAPLIDMKFAYSAWIAPYDWLSRALARLRWVSVHADTAETRYESFPIAPVYEMQKLLEKTHQQLAEHALSLPIFVMQSAEDETIDAQKTWDFFAANHHPASRLLWFSATSAHPATADTRITILTSYLPQQHILSMSHLSFALPESDPIFGRQGRYKDCLYYAENSPTWQQCKRGSDTVFGEITPENLQRYVIQRLTFNPFFNEMMKRLDAFVSQK